MEKYLHLFAVAIDSEGIPENIIAPRLKGFKGYLTLKLHPTPLSVQGSVHPTPKCERTNCGSEE